MVELNIDLPGVVGTTVARCLGHRLGQAIFCSVAWWLPWGEVACHVAARSPPSSGSGPTQFTLQIPHLNQHMNKQIALKPTDNVAIAYLTK